MFRRRSDTHGKTRMKCFVLFLSSVALYVHTRRVTLHQDSSISALACCHLIPERAENFLQALISWLFVTEISEIVLVDWRSTLRAVDLVVNMSQLVYTQNKRVILVEVLPEFRHSSGVGWRIGAAFNLALSYTNTEYILKLDCDTWLHKDFIKMNSLSGVGFRYGNWETARDDNDRHLNGVFFARTKHLRGVHGFDERLALYGWDDSDLYLRLERQVSEENYTVAYEDFVRRTGNMSAITHLNHSRRTDATLEKAGILLNKKFISHAQVWNGTGGYKYTEKSMKKVKQNIITHTVTTTHVATAIQNTLDVQLCAKLALACANYVGLQKNVAASICSISLEELRQLS